MGSLGFREKYLLNNWTKLKRSQRLALAKHVYWFGISSNETCVLSLDFISEFQEYIMFSALFRFGVVCEEVLDRYHVNIIPEYLKVVFMRNQYSEEYLMDRLSVFVNYADTIANFQVSLSSESRQKYLVLKELID